MTVNNEICPLTIPYGNMAPLVYVGWGLGRPVCLCFKIHYVYKTLFHFPILHFRVMKMWSTHVIPCLVILAHMNGFMMIYDDDACK